MSRLSSGLGRCGQVALFLHQKGSLMKFHKGMAVLALVAAGITFAAAPAFADDDSGTAGTSGTVEVGGREFGPADGVSVTTESFEITPGTGETLGAEWGGNSTPGTITPQVYWGTSYAYSTEYAYLFYHGVAKAAANVYSGQRIIQVCIQYTRNGAPIADKRCSSAVSNGIAWSAGPEVGSWATDSPYDGGPKTIFNIQTTRIDPRIL